jgi:UrcA family protein
MSWAGVFGICLVLLLPGVPVDTRAAEEPPEIFEIVVTAPRVTVQENRRPLRGDQVSMSYAVSYADLDLTEPDGRSELEERVRETAEDICEFLTERYSVGRSSASCTREALRDAMEQVREAVEAASR